MESNIELKQLNESIKKLLIISKLRLINMLNNLFINEDFNEDELDVESLKVYILSNNLEINFFRHTNKKLYYNIKAELLNKNKMSITMLKYDNITQNDKENLPTAFFNMAFVYFTDTGNITHTVEAKFLFPSIQKINFEVPAIRYWEYSLNELKENGYYLFDLFRLLYLTNNSINM